MFDKQRATTFGANAASYDEYRPSYPAEVIDIILEGEPNLVVDAGCGTGIAARLVADRGVSVLGVEPDERMADVARSHGIDVTVSSIEQWDPVVCDAMYAAQAWHWVEPTAGAEAAAAALRPGGRWYGIWNYETNSLFGDCLERVYQRLAPELAGITARIVDDALRASVADAMQATGAFDELVVRQVEWSDALSVEAAVGRLATHSKHQQFEAKNAVGLDSALLAELAPHGERVTLPYTTRVFSVRRK